MKRLVLLFLSICAGVMAQQTHNATMLWARPINSGTPPTNDVLCFNGTIWTFCAASSFSYPGAGIVVSTGSAWGTSLSNPLTGTNGGTGANNGSSTFTIGGNTAFSGAYTFTGTLTNNTSVTFPTSGTLSTTTGTVTSVGLAGTANQITVSGTSPITTSGSWTLSLTAGVILGTDNSTAGTLQLANGSANAHTIWGSGATITNTILGFATAPTTGHLVTSAISAALDAPGWAVRYRDGRVEAGRQA